MNVKEAIAERRSVRLYRSEKPTRESIVEVLEAARLAPSAVNRQPWHFYAFASSEKLSRLSEAYARDWFKTAPVVIVAVANHGESWHRGNDGKDHADVDLAIAIDHMTLRATELGLGTCWVCNFDASVVRKELGLGENEEPIALIPIGFADETEVVKPKTRKGASEVYTIEGF